MGKEKKEKQTSNFVKKLFQELDKIDDFKKTSEKQEKRIIELIKNYSIETMDFSENESNLIFSPEYLAVTKSFLNKIQKSYPQMDKEDVFQALRNVWISNNIQALLNLKIRLTPSIFAYSLLYPYSDNFLDNSEISINDKKSFNNRFEKILLGENVDLINKNEQEIFNLVKIIEKNYARDEYSNVYKALLAIHQGQKKSLLQQSKFLTEEEVLNISLHKGGSSVLADLYLVSGNASKEEAYFFFGYGVLLQIMDDLQDIKIDLEKGHQTIFTKRIKTDFLDDITNQLFYFMIKVLNLFSIFKTDIASCFKKIIMKSCLNIIYGAIAENKEYYSKRYVKKIEKHSIVYFKYRKKLKKKIEEKYSIL